MTDTFFEDVGGGSVDNDTKNNLARITLRWMIRECFKTNTGIMFESDGLRNIGLDPDALYPEVLPRPAPIPLDPKTSLIQDIPPPTPKVKANEETSLPNFAHADTNATSLKPRQTEEELDLIDALSPIYDQLSLKWFWWILELFPVKQRYQKGDTSWVSYLGWNMGRGRFIPKQKQNGVRVHRSVKTRLEAMHKDGSKYVPKAAFDLACVTWVD